MKKVALAITLFLSLIGTAQNQTTITIQSVAPDPVYPGDTLAINFTFKAPTGIGSVNQDQWYISSTSKAQISGISYKTYYSMPKYFDGVDTMYQLKIKTLDTHANGAGTVKVSSGNEIQFSFCCNVTGITEHQLQQIAPVYFDMFGSRITPQPNMIMIEQKGNVRRKVIIQN